jgi:nickel-dependent lactate racemase
MTDSSFSLTYGKEMRSFTVPGDRLSGPLIAPRKVDPLKGTISDILKSALAKPVGRPLLRELSKDRSVAIIISDEFRSGLQHEILDAILEEVISGKPEAVIVFCATGTHAPEVYAKKAGEWVKEAEARLGFKIEFEPHDSEKSEFCDLGHTTRGTNVRINKKLMECDVRVYGHESKHHYLNGYSCVDKQVLPGVCWGETVAQSHKWALDPDSAVGRNPWHSNPDRQSNPFAEDIMEARLMSEKFVMSPSGKAVRGEVDSYALDMVSAKNEIYWVRAGDPNEVCREMVRVVDEMMEFEVEPAKYVIVSPGGPPASQALYGTQNAFDLAMKGAIREDGEALVIAPLNGRPDLPEEVRGLAPDLRPKKLFWDNLVRLRTMPLAEARKEIADNFELYLWKTDRVLRLLNGKKIGIHIHSELSADVLAPGGFQAAQDIQAWIDERVQRNDGKFIVINDANKLCVTAKK